MDNQHHTTSNRPGAQTAGKVSRRYMRLAMILALYVCLPDVHAQGVRVSQQIAAAVLNITAQNVPAAEAALMTEFIKNELLNAGTYSIVEKQRLDAVISEQSFQHFGLTEAEFAVELGKILSVNTIFIGTLGVIRNDRILAVRMVNVETGQIVKSVIERDFSARDASLAARRAVQALLGLAIDEITPEVLIETRSDVGRYVMLYSGWSLGSLLDYHAQSVFESGPVPGEPIWSGLAAEVRAHPRFPGVGLRLGAWRRWFGGDVEISALSYTTPGQDVFYDMSGYIRVEDQWIPVYIDTLELPENFQRMYALGFGGNFYVHIPSKVVQPYLGVGASLLMNRVISDFPGPGNMASGLEGVPLNSTSLGWAAQLLIGFKYPLADKKFVYVEFRPARHFFSIVSGDGFQRERDQFTLQSFQLVVGYGFLLR